MESRPTVDPTALERLARLGGAKLVRDMTELFLTHGRERLDALQAGASAGDADAVARAAHSLKSSAGNLGARQLQHTAEVLEALASDGVLDADLVARLATEYEASAEALVAAGEKHRT